MFLKLEIRERKDSEVDCSQTFRYSKILFEAISMLLEDSCHLNVVVWVVLSTNALALELTLTDLPSLLVHYHQFLHFLCHLLIHP